MYTTFITLQGKEETKLSIEILVEQIQILRFYLDLYSFDQLSDAPVGCPIVLGRLISKPIRPVVWSFPGALNHGL